jgi:hypothetical protein
METRIGEVKASPIHFWAGSKRYNRRRFAGMEQMMQSAPERSFQCQQN